MDKAVDTIDVSDVEKSMFDKLRNHLIKNLDVYTDGNIKPNIKNLRQVQNVDFLKELLITDKYVKKVNEFVGAFDEVAEMNKQYMDAELS